MRNDPELVLRVALRYATANRTAASGGYFQLNDPILYGKWKNHHGKLVAFGSDKHGNPTITIQPVPQGRKQLKTMGLFKVWHDPPPAMRNPQIPAPAPAAGTPVLADVTPDNEEEDEE